MRWTGRIMRRASISCCGCSTAPCGWNRRPQPRRIRRSIEAYFDGDLAAVADLPVITAGTAFQREVWAALRRISTGETTTYGRLASQLGRPKAMRAVGHGQRLQPDQYHLPCHRVIGANAALTGYGGGIERKRWLLRHEGALPE